MNTKKMILCLFAAIAAISLLSGCGNDAAVNNAKSLLNKKDYFGAVAELNALPQKGEVPALLKNAKDKETQQISLNEYTKWLEGEQKKINYVQTQENASPDNAQLDIYYQKAIAELQKPPMQIDKDLSAAHQLFIDAQKLRQKGFADKFKYKDNKNAATDVVATGVFAAFDKETEFHGALVKYALANQLLISYKYLNN